MGFIYPSLHSAFHRFHCIIPKPSYSFKYEVRCRWLFFSSLSRLLSISSFMYNEPDKKTEGFVKTRPRIKGHKYPKFAEIAGSLPKSKCEHLNECKLQLFYISEEMQSFVSFCYNSINDDLFLRTLSCQFLRTNWITHVYIYIILLTN